MRFYVALFHVISIFAISGSTLGNHAEVDCGHGTAPPKSLHTMLFDSLDKCFVKIGGLDFEELKSISSLYMPLESIREYCEKQDSIRSCISTIKTSSSACHNETQRDEFVLLEEILNTGLNYSCDDRGHLFAPIVFGVFHEETSTPERNAVTDCIDAGESTPVEDDTATGLLRLHREVNTFKRCLVTRLRGLNRAVFNVELMWNRILRSMKCHRPDDATTVPCVTLSPITDEKACLFKDGHDDEIPRFVKLIDYAAECIKVNVNQLQFHSLEDFTTLEEHQSFVKTYCQNRPLVHDCLGDVSSNSKICLNETHHKTAQTLIDFFKHTLETSCKADGVNLATIFYEVLNHKTGAVNNETFRNCLLEGEKAMKSVKTDNESLAHFIVRIYRTLETTKQCILDGASEGSTFTSVVGTFINEVLPAAKCVNPEDETVVPCATLVNN